MSATDPTPHHDLGPVIEPSPGPNLSPGFDATRRPLRRALISVYDKTGLVELGQALAAADVEIVSTGSTAATLAAAGVPVTPVEQLTGFPECLDGRVKTLHPRIHAGILADLRLSQHGAQLADLGIAPFELVVVNLYPFAATVASGAGFDACVEQIDIGGPSMVRAAAKNHPSVAVVTDPGDYVRVTQALEADGFTLEQRRALAAAAFAHTAAYDVAVASYFASQLADTDAPTPPAPAEAGGEATDRENAGVAATSGTGPTAAERAEPAWPSFLGATFALGETLRYGENPHQAAALYRDASGTGLAHATQLHGKAMSYNNYVDADAAWRAAHDFAEPAVAIIKHANPCGIAVGADIAAAHAAAHACDPVSAFGGVIAANREITAVAARQIAEVFTEVVIAPGFEAEALEILQGKKNVRLLRLAATSPAPLAWREVSGGMLVQDIDRIDAVGDDPASWRLVAGEVADAPTLADLSFAWRACRAVKSNAITLARAGSTVGVGMGQVNRVDSCRLAVERAGSDRAREAVAASDAFFPFADGLQVLIDAGVRAVVEPGGSVRDAEVIEAAEAAGLTLYFTGTRHFAH